MASPPALADGDIESWGPDARPDQVRFQRSIDLAAARLGLSIEIAGEMVRQLDGRHRYVLLEQLARSSHAIVYVAIDQMLAREVALKVNLEPMTGHRRWNAFREARTQVMFDHPHVVRVLDVGEHEGLSYTVTELCDTDMNSWARGEPWPAVVERIIEAGRGLELLHAARLVHGDVKPANILIKDGIAKIGDFGLTAPVERAGQLVGTAGFIAPELAAGFRAPAVDVFALAVSVWVCVFGELPFEGPTAAELDGDKDALMRILLERALDERWAEPPTDSEVPRELVEIIRAGLAAVPQRRPSMAAWLRRMEAVVAAPEEAQRLEQMERSAETKRRWLPSFAAGLVVGGVSVVLVTIALLGPEDASEGSEAPSQVGTETFEPELAGSAATEGEEPELELPPTYLEEDKLNELPAEFVEYTERWEDDLKSRAILQGDEALQTYADQLITRAEQLITSPSK